ncbi:MAG: GGDEF domain-containing protein [Alphaproteobacteria bacterium]|nr:GGDEF domain-containing protein [Alphaproteobacteria bacterium]
MRAYAKTKQDANQGRWKMGIFGTPRTQPVAGESTEASTPAGFEFGERKDIDGPLPIGDNIVEMVQWLESARNKVAESNATCCVAVCAPNPIEGAALELTLGEIADRFAISLRSYDKLFFHGRGKLLIALPHVKPEDATSVMQRLHDIVERMPFKMPGSGLDLSVTVSLGAALMDGSSVQELINRADKAMEMGRISGNRNCIWSPELA